MKFQFYALKLVGVCIVIYILQLMYPVVTDTFILVTKDVLVRPWTLVTSIFLHDPYDSSHLLLNMLALGLFGSILERLTGSKKFLILFFSTGILGSIGSLFFYDAVLGASGAIMGVIGCLAAIRPKMMVWTPFGVPMPVIMVAGIWAMVNLTGLFYPSNNIAYASHLTGLYSGIIIGLIWRKRFRELKTKRTLSEKELDKWEDEYMNHKAKII